MFPFPLLSTVRPPNVIPQIQGCRRAKYQEIDGQICHISVSDKATLNCSVHGYYPTITLYFYHIYRRLPAINITEWENGDGTKSQTITLEVVASNYPYFCVASDLPGSIGNDRDGLGIICVASYPEGTTPMDTDIMTTPQNEESWNPVNHYGDTVFGEWNFTINTTNVV